VGRPGKRTCLPKRIGGALIEEKKPKTKQEKGGKEEIHISKKKRPVFL